MNVENDAIEVEFLGTGTSTGVPQIGCRCSVCQSKDYHDKRMRSSVIVRTQGKTLHIDCGPDFRTQILRTTDTSLDALIITHVHYDHVGGIDDLRPYSYRPGNFPIYARPDVMSRLRINMPYSFSEHPYPGAPLFAQHELVNDDVFSCEGVTVLPLPVWHGKLLMNGYRIGDMAYITDAKIIEQSTLDRLAGVRLLIINGLRITPHDTHMSLSDALEVIAKVKPEQAYITHVSHQLGLHAEVSKTLPQGVSLAYDGLIVRLK